jgi:hypothetical protein
MLAPEKVEQVEIVRDAPHELVQRKA